MKLEELIEHLQKLPQEYDVWSNDGYFDYADYPCEADSLRIDVSDKDRRIRIGENL